MLASLNAQQTIFVKHDAAGANNGTSWANAYTTLYAALNAANPGDQLWVAAGTYKPDPATANSSFLMEAGIALYGGFAGTETQLSARNPAVNVTILNGDMAGNDIVGNFGTNRADNSNHVVEIVPSAEPTDRAILDGFTVSGGNTQVGTAAPPATRYGGGVLTTAKLTARNCIFTDNNGEFGGGLAAVDAAASGLLVDNCIFEKSTTSALSAGLYLNNLTSGADINRCSFRDNTTIRGSLYFITCGQITVDSCLFLNNTAGTQPCGGMYTWKTPFTLSNSTFVNNVGADYGAMYNDGREGVFPFTIVNCTFEGNKATDTDAAASAFGGAVFNATATGLFKKCTFRFNQADLGAGIYVSGAVAGNPITVDSCLFESNAVAGTGSRGAAFFSNNGNYEIKNSTFMANTAGISGGAIHNANASMYYIHDCTFTGGSAGFGGAVSNYNPGTGTYENCLFQNNSAATSGGAVTNGFTANVTYKNCTMETNTARFGGALFAQNNDTRVTIQDCIFSSNNAEVSGGGINLSAGIKMTMQGSLVEANSSDTGGGLNISDDTINVGATIIRNSVIFSNFCNTQAAGLNVSNTDVLLENCLFAANLNVGTGAGGAVSNNASGLVGGLPATSPIKAVNCTFADNVAEIGGGIAQWTDGTALATLELLNCILSNNLASNYEIEDGLPTVLSLGGNLCSDATLTAVLTGVNDLAELDPLFVDPSSYDFHLQPNSPCIDKGIALGAPTTDLEGNPRSGAGPDQGCYEFETSGIKGLTRNVLPLRLAPNPAAEYTIVTLENDWSGEVQLRIVAQNGALVQSLNASKPAGRWVQQLNVRELPTGVYSVQVFAGSTLFENSLVKR